MARTLKQVIYGALLLLVIAVLILFIYFKFFWSAPSCFDGIKNQDEAGIDCGGVCGRSCTPNDFKPIEQVSDVSIMKVDENRLSLMVEIKNPNQNFAAKYFDYSFNLYNVGNKLIKTITGQSYIYAGEIKYLAIPKEDIKPTEVSSVELKIENPSWVVDNRFPKPKLRVQSKETNLFNNQIEVNGNLVSEDSVDFENIEIIAIFLNNSNRPIGVSATTLSSLKSGETKAFTIKHPPIQSETPIAQTQISPSAFRP